MPDVGASRRDPGRARLPGTTTMGILSSRRRLAEIKRRGGAFPASTNSMNHRISNTKLRSRSQNRLGLCSLKAARGGSRRARLVGEEERGRKNPISGFACGFCSAL